LEDEPRIIRLARRRMLVTPVRKPPEKIRIPVRGSTRKKPTRIVKSTTDAPVKPRLKPNHR
jgi:hypothetical protein